MQARCLHNGMLVLPAPKLDAHPSSLVRYLSLHRFSSLAHFAGHILDSQADLTVYTAAASLQALSYFSGPAEQCLALARALLGTSRADLRSEQLHGREIPLGAVIDRLAQRGQQGAALAAELLCLTALSAEWGAMTGRLIKDFQALCAASSLVASSAAHTSRLPLQLDGEKCLFESCQHPAAVSALRKRDRTPFKTSEVHEAAEAGEQLPGSYADQDEAQHDLKRPRLGETSAGTHVQRPAADRSSTDSEAAGQEALALAECILSNDFSNDWSGSAAEACSSGRELQDAMVAVHPALMAEVARKSFRACRAYLSLLIKQPDDGLQAVVAGILHMLRLGGRPAELTKLSLTAIHLQSTD